MSKPEEVEIGKRKLSSEEFVAICTDPSIQITINPAALASLEEHSTKRFPEFDLLQYREEIQLVGKLSSIQTRGVLLLTSLTLLQDRLHVRPALVQVLVDLLNFNILPTLPALSEATDKQIMTDLLDSIDPSSPQSVVVDLPQDRIPPSPNNNEARRLLQLAVPTQSFYIIAAYQLQQSARIVDIPIALALEVTGISTEPFQPAHHETAHPHPEAIQTCQIVRGIVSNSQYIGRSATLLKQIKDETEYERTLNMLTLPESISQVPDLHGVLKHAITDAYNISRKEIISGDSISQTDNVFSGIQNLAYIHFSAQHLIDVIITFLQSSFNRLQYVLMNAKLFDLTLADVDLEKQDEIANKILAETQIFTNGLHLVESLVTTNELVSFFFQIVEKLRLAILYETAVYLHILQISTVRYAEQQQDAKAKKYQNVLKKVADLRTAGKDDAANKILKGWETTQAKEKAAQEEALAQGKPAGVRLPVGTGTNALFSLFFVPILPPASIDEQGDDAEAAAVASRDAFEGLIVPFTIVLSRVSEQFSSNDPSFQNALSNVLHTSSSIEVKMPKGTRDLTQEMMVAREATFNLISRIFKQHGAGAIDTPVFERREILTGKYGEDSKLIYDLADQGGELLSLRYDLTVPFARFCATNGISNIKRFHIGKVYRRDQPVMTKGRFREFYQCDFDIAGEGAPMVNDSEVISSMARILRALPLGKFTIKLSHRRLLDAIMTVCGVPRDNLRPICSAIDKLDKETWENVKIEMVQQKGLPEHVADALQPYVTLPGNSITNLLQTLEVDEKLSVNADAKAAFEELHLLSDYLTALDVIQNVTFDLSLARGLDYYTGVIFEAVLLPPTAEEIAAGEIAYAVGSIGAGGRYDKLVGMFSGKDVPAVGASIGIERIFTILEQRERALAEKRNKQLRHNFTQVLVASNPAGADKYNLLVERMKLASVLRSAGIAVEYLPQPSPNIRKQMIFAEQNSIPIIVWVGVDELDAGNVSVKVLKENADDSEKPNVVKREALVPLLQKEIAALIDTLPPL